MNRRSTTKRLQLVRNLAALFVGGAVLSPSIAPLANAATVTWDANAATASQTDGAGAWLGTNQWWDGSTNVDWTSGDDAIFGNGGAGGAVTLASPTTVNSLTFNTFTGTYTLGTTGQAITLNNGITLNAGAGAVTLLSPTTLGAVQSWTNNATSALTFNSTTGLDNAGNTLTIGGTGNTTFTGAAGNVITGAGGLTKNGSGTLELGGSGTPQTHTFTGTTTINGGVVRINSGTFNNSTGTGNLTMNGGILEGYFGGTFTRGLGVGAGQIQILGGTTGFGGQGATGTTFNIGGAAATLVWGSSFFNPTVFALQAATANSNGKVTLSNGIDLAGTNRTITSLQNTDGAAGSGATISGVISNSSGTAGFEKTGPGNLILGNAANSFNGPLTISGGWITAGSSGALGNASNSIIFNGGTLRATAAITSPATRSVTMTATGIFDSNGQAISIAGDIGGAGGLTKNGAGTLTLSGTNSYGGVTTVNAGTLAITKEAALYNATPVSWTAANINVKNAAGLALNVDSAGTAGLTASNLNTLLGNISVANTAAQGLQAGSILSLDTSTASGGTFTQGNAITNSTGAFGGLISLVKLGAGTLVLDKANSYTGTTTVSGGTLQLNDGGAISTPPLFLNGGTFAVNRTGTTTQGTNIPAFIGGTGSLANVGSGTLVLNAPTYHTGTTAATAGNITMSHVRAIQFSALDTTGTGSVTLSGVTTPIIGGLANSGVTRDVASVIDGSYASVTNLTLNPQSGSSFTYSGAIANGVANMDVTKTNAGTQILTGTNTYTGKTYLNGGVLQVGSGATIGKLSGTTDLAFSGGTLTFVRSTNANIDAINNAATITSNGGTFNVTPNDAGGASAQENIGAVSLNSGQMNFNYTGNASSGTQTIFAGLTQSGTAAATFSGTLSTSRFKVTGAGTTTAGQIIGPWATTGASNGINAQTDYAVYSSDFVSQAGIAATAETAWTTAGNAYTMGANQTLTATRTITALRNTVTTTPQLTLATGANLETYGVLNGAANATLTIAPGTGGVLTTPTGGGNLYLTMGPGGTGVPGTMTISAPINNNSGNVTVVKNGSGTLTLSSTASDYSGGTVINAGTLQIAADTNLGAAGTGITFSGNATLNNSTGTTLVDLGARSVTLNNGAIATITGSARGNIAIGGAITGSGGLSLAHGTFWGKAALNSTANTFTGPITVTSTGDDGNSVFSINSLADGAGFGAITLNNSSTDGDVIGLDYGTGGTNGTGGGGAIAPLVLNNRQIILATNSNNLINNGSNQALTINTDIGFSGTGARSIRLGANARAGSGVSTVAGKLTDNVGGALNVSFGGGTWVVTGNNNSYTGTTGVSAGNVTISGNNTLTGQITVSGNAGATLTLSGNNSGMTAPVVLSTATGTVGSSPRLNINSATALGTGTLTFGGGAASDVVRIDNTSPGPITVSTSNPITMNRNFTFVGTQDLNLGTGLTTLGGMTSGSARSITVTANTLTMPGNITEATTNLGITKAGAGTLALSGTNTYTGLTTVSAGVLLLNSANALPGGINTTGGTSALTLNGGILGLGNGDFTRALGTGADQVSITGATSGFAAFGADRTVNIGGAGGTLSFNSANFPTSSFVLSHATSDATTILANSVSFGGGGRTITVNDGSAAVDARITGALTNSNGFTKNGAGFLQLTATNDMTGTLTISAGTLQLGNNGATGNFSAISTINNNASLSINHSNAFTQVTDLNNTVIGGTGSFSQVGSGTTTLSLANTYTGATNVSAGKLLINGNQSTATGAVNVSALATLGGSGTIGGLTTVASTGIVAPGNSAGNLTFGAGADLSAGGVYSWELGALSTSNPGTDFDTITVSGGNLALGGTSALTLDFALVSPNGPNSADTFWTTSQTWKIIDVTTGTNTGDTNISTITNATYSSGSFTTTVGGVGPDQGDIFLVFTPGGPAGPSVWQGANNDNWTAAGSWSGSVPNSNTAEAKFVTTGGTTANLDANQTVNKLTFDATAPHTISGASTLTLAGSTPVISTAGSNTATQTVAVNLNLAAGTAINVQGGTLELNSPANAVLGAGVTATVASGATLSLGGAGNALSNGTSTHANVANSGTLVATTAGKRVGEISGSGTTTVTAAGATLTANHIRQSTLNIGAGNTVTVATNGGNSGTSTVTNLNINATGKLDLANNDLIVDNGNLATLTAKLASGLDINGTYGNGPGITSSAFATNPNFNTVLGIAANVELGYTSFSGQTVDANDILIKYTYYGDADLSGSVDTSTDFDLYITGLTSGGSLGGWLFGDFDYSGTVDSSTDFDLYITGLTTQGGALLTAGGGGNLVQAVPEPSTFVLGGLALLGFAGVGLRKRRSVSEAGVR